MVVTAGGVTSALDSPPGPGNALVAGLRSSHAVIKCPAVARPAAVSGR